MAYNSQWLLLLFPHLFELSINIYSFPYHIYCLGNMIQATGKFLLSNAISIDIVGCEIRIQTPIALLHLPQPLHTYQSYLIVIQSSEAAVPSSLRIPSNLVFFTGDLTFCPRTHQPQIAVELWKVDKMAQPYELEHLHVYGVARVVRVHQFPNHQCVTMMGIVGTDTNQVCSPIKIADYAHFSMILKYLVIPCFWSSLNQELSRSLHQAKRSLTHSKHFNLVIVSILLGVEQVFPFMSEACHHFMYVVYNFFQPLLLIQCSHIDSYSALGFRLS